MDCGAFYGQLNSLVATTPTSGSPFQRRNDSSSSSVASGSIPTSMPMEYANRFSGGIPGGTPLSRGSRSLEQKMDTILQAFEKQQDENAALKPELRALQEKIDINCIGASNTNKKARIPSSLSVSALCSSFNFTFL